MTAEELTQRGYCCGMGCKECPYYPRSRYGNTVLAKDIKKESIKYNTVNKDQKLMEEAYNKVLEADVERLAQQDPREMYSDEEVKAMDTKPELAQETGPEEAFKTLENALGQFYALGKKGLGADADAVNERVTEILRQHEVDDRDMRRFADALTSILLGQSMRGFAEVQ